LFPDSWAVAKLGSICRLDDGDKLTGTYHCLDAKYLRGKSAPTIMNNGKFVHKGDNIILVDGENSGEVFSVPEDGYMGSTFKQLLISSAMYLPYVLSVIRFYKDELRNSKKGAAIPHLNKEIFYNLIIGIPPFEEQRRIVDKVTELSQLLK
jgi:type I restriction enzyme, S subunit